MTKIWSAAIDDDENGTTLYAAWTHDDLFRRLADYCRSRWDSDGPGEPVPEKNFEAVTRYFQFQTEAGGSDWYVASAIDMPAAPGAASPELLSYRVQVEYRTASGGNSFTTDVLAHSYDGAFDLAATECRRKRRGCTRVDGGHLIGAPIRPTWIGRKSTRTADPSFLTVTITIDHPKAFRAHMNDLAGQKLDIERAVKYLFDEQVLFGEAQAGRIAFFYPQEFSETDPVGSFAIENDIQGDTARALLRELIDCSAMDEDVNEPEIEELRDRVETFLQGAES